MISRIQRCLTAAVVLFPEKHNCTFAGHLLNVLRRMRRELPENCSGFVPENGEDTIDALNRLSRYCCERSGFRNALDHALLETLTEQISDLKTMNEVGEDGAFLYHHALALAAELETLIPDFASAIPEGTRLFPSVKNLSSSGSLFLRLKIPAVILECKKQNRSSSRVCRYDDAENKLIPLELKKIRDVSAFFGYHSARKTFLDHFGAFAAGKSNLPLLISSLPGLGKTQMTISHSLHYPQITLVLASPDALSCGLERMIRLLEKMPDQKFMVFFDDIDVPQMNWYDFRTQVGGAFSLPENISFTIAANQQFPANISSRGRGFLFPIFDEIRCQEMIEDFLIASGMRNPAGELISVIAADYVESFGQKMFEELSPRTLVRYLEQYRTDEKRRRRMLDSSRQEVITRPDPQVFYDENLKLMRAIYGDSVLDDLRNRELGMKNGK